MGMQQQASGSAQEAKGQTQALAQALAQSITPARVAEPASPNGIIEVQTAPWNSQNSAVSHSRDSHSCQLQVLNPRVATLHLPPPLLPPWHPARHQAALVFWGQVGVNIYEDKLSTNPSIWGLWRNGSAL
jgi:hypothetical protein